MMQQTKITIEDVNLTYERTTGQNRYWNEYYEWEGTVMYDGQHYKGTVAFKYERMCNPASGTNNELTILSEQPSDVDDGLWDEIHDQIEEAVVKNHDEHPDQWH